MLTPFITSAATEQLLCQPTTGLTRWQRPSGSSPLPRTGAPQRVAPRPAACAGASAQSSGRHCCAHWAAAGPPLRQVLRRQGWPPAAAARHPGCLALPQGWVGLGGWVGAEQLHGGGHGNTQALCCLRNALPCVSVRMEWQLQACGAAMVADEMLPQLAAGRLLHYFAPDASESADAAGGANWCGWCVCSLVATHVSCTANQQQPASCARCPCSASQPHVLVRRHFDNGSLTGLTSAMYLDASGQPAACPDPGAGLHIKDRAGQARAARVSAVPCLAGHHPCHSSRLPACRVPNCKVCLTCALSCTHLPTCRQRGAGADPARKLGLPSGRGAAGAQWQRAPLLCDDSFRG